MKTPSPGRIFTCLWLFLALVGCASAASSKTTTTQTGENTYTTVTKASTAFNRDIDALTAEAQAAAVKYCTALGKQMKVISVTSDKPMFATGYARATVVFQALDAGDPELAVPVTTAVTSSGSKTVQTTVPLAAPVAAPAAPLSPTDALYHDLMKLDDLRKKGVLTEEEFQAEKKKVLSRSQ